MTLPWPNLKNYRHMPTSSKNCAKRTSSRDMSGLSQHLFSKSLRANTPSHSGA
ncbi:hypothetical protein EMPG_16765 [Blastomyces silverae]|uniref:Uncharacterized protein n=1 Tax=Blastomyces silverae TaxID=2060906 RepID=A0A0H1B9I7_9EURO|nr:hypothetical protein EMPG_16765 [Blastomyces silverae]